MRHIAIIVPTYALRYVQTRTRSREGYVELACILSQEAWVVATVEVGHTSVDSVEDDDVVELQTLRLVYCRDEDALVDATASAEVGFFQRTYLHGVVGELLVERRLRCAVNHILREISRDVAQAANRLYHVVGKERVVEALQLGNQRHPILHSLHIRRILILGIRRLRGCTCLKCTNTARGNLISYIHTCDSRTIYLAVIAAQYINTLTHTGIAEERALLLYPFLCLFVAMHDDAARCVHVVVGKVRVRTLQAEHREQRLQLVLAQLGMQQSYKAKRVEIVGVRLVQVVLGCVAAQVMVEDVPVVVGIVSEQAASVGILHEHTECSVVRVQRGARAACDACAPR